MWKHGIYVHKGLESAQICHAKCFPLTASNHRPTPTGLSSVTINQTYYHNLLVVHKAHSLLEQHTRASRDV